MMHGTLAMHLQQVDPPCICVKHDRRLYMLPQTRPQVAPPMAANQKSSAMRHVPYFFSTCQPMATMSAMLEKTWLKPWCTNTDDSHLREVTRVIASSDTGKKILRGVEGIPVSLTFDCWPVEGAPKDQEAAVKLPCMSLKAP